MQSTTPTADDDDPRDESILSIRNLQTVFRTDHEHIRAVDGISLSISPGETLGIVGESGSGKSVTARSIMGLVDAPGEVLPSPRSSSTVPSSRSPAPTSTRRSAERRRHDLPGPAEIPEPRLHGGQPDPGGPPDQPRDHRPGGHGRRHRPARRRRDPRPRAATRRVPQRVLRGCDSAQ